jgi:hypothetical protein
VRICAPAALGGRNRTGPAPRARSAMSPPRRAGSTRCLPHHALIADVCLLLHRAVIRKKMLCTKDEINCTRSINHDTVLTSGMPAISRISMVRNWWCRQLRGRERKSDQTLRSYRRSIETFLRFCDDTGEPREVTKTNVIAWLDAQHDPLAPRRRGFQRQGNPPRRHPLPNRWPPIRRRARVGSPRTQACLICGSR